MENGITTVERNKTLVRSLYEDYINSRKLDQMEALISQDFTGPRGEHGPREFRASIESVLAGFPDVRFEIQELFGEGDKVAVHWTFRAVHKGTFFGLPPSHADVTQEGNAIYQLQEGQIVRAWLQVDRLGVLQQIGAVPRSFTAAR